MPIEPGQTLLHREIAIKVMPAELATEIAIGGASCEIGLRSFGNSSKAAPLQPTLRPSAVLMLCSSRSISYGWNT